MKMAPSNGNNNNNNNNNRNRSKDIQQKVLTAYKKVWSNDSKKQITKSSPTMSDKEKLYQEFEIYTGA